MLQTIHDRLKGIFAITILVALGVVFVFWGINFSTDFGGFTRAQGVEVNGREVPVEEVRQDYQQQLSRMQAAFGEAGVPEKMQTSMQKQVLDQAVRTELIRQRTLKLGFEATDAEVLEAIRQVPAFQVDGQFSRDAYLAALGSINMSPERFEAEQRQYVLARHLDRGLYSSAFVLPGRARAARGAARGDAHHRLGRGPGARVSACRRARRRGHCRVLRGEPGALHDRGAGGRRLRRARHRRLCGPGRRQRGGAAGILRGEQGAVHAGGPPPRAPHPVCRRERRRSGRGEREARLRARRRRRGLCRARARAVRGPGLEGFRGRPRRGRARGFRRAFRRCRLEHEAGRDPRAGKDRVRLARDQARERFARKPPGASRKCAPSSSPSSAGRRSKKPSATPRRSSTRWRSRPRATSMPSRRN